MSKSSDPKKFMRLLDQTPVKGPSLKGLISPPFGNVRGKNKKKVKSQFFFLVGANFILSEDSSNIEYSVSALSDFINKASLMSCIPTKFISTTKMLRY